MIVDPVTLRWAEALYALARKQGVLDFVKSDVARLATALAGTAGDAVFQPRLDRAARRSLVLARAGNAHVLVTNFVELAFDRRREQVLRGIGAAFRRLELAEHGIAEGIVQSARPLGAAELDLIARSVGAELGKQVVLENVIVPELVGGARVIAANRMIDWSVQGRLEALRRKMMEARMPAAGAASV